MKKYEITILLICLMVSSTGFIGAFSQPIANDIIVTFGHTAAETKAVRTLVTNLDNPLIVEYGTIGYTMAKMRGVRSLILVGHGTDKGVAYHGRIINTKTIARDIGQSVAQNYYILACHSEKIASHTNLVNVVAFKGIVDAEIGALTVATVIRLRKGQIDLAFNVFDKLTSTLRAKYSGESTFMPLHVDDGTGSGGGGGSSPPPPPTYNGFFSEAEKNHFIAILLIGAAASIICTSAVYLLGKKFAPAAEEAVSEISATTKDKIVQVLIRVGKYSTPANTAINTIFGSLFVLAMALSDAVSKCVSIAINNMNLAEWALFISLTALETLAIILSAGEALAVRIVVGITVAVANADIIGWADYMDSDGNPCGSVLEAISQLYG
ncbi:MAG: hypothetical protein ACTSYL_00735 [Candidatus Thorarchaeota archaeon]